MEESLQRVLQSIDYLKSIGKIHKRQDIADIMHMGKSRISEALSGKKGKFTDFFLEQFAATFSDYINEEWLLEGKGQMENVSRTMRPHYEATAAAGFMDGYSEAGMSAQFRQMVVGLKDYDFTVRVKGDSMLPRIEDGDVLMCHKVNDRLNPPIGKICVLDTKEGMVVKEIVGADEDFVFVHSLNPEYRDYKIEHTSILGIARVVASIREY